MKKIIRKCLPYCILTLLVIFFLQLFFGFLNVDLSVPIEFRRDYVFTYAVVKSFLENQWGIFQIPQNVYIGAPGISSLEDFPVFDSNLMYMIIKPISFFSKDYATVTHIYYFLTFVLVAYTAFYVFKKFRIDNKIAIFGSLLFAFAPFHIYRTIMHINLSSYYLIPLMLLVVFYIWSKKPIFFKYTNKKWHLNLNNKKAIFTIIVAILCGLSNIYFDYFWLFFLTVAGISAFFYRKNIYNFLSYVIVVFLNIFVILLNASPYIIYKIQNGSNYDVIHRHFCEIEYYGLKIIQMLLPVDNHFTWQNYTSIYNYNSFLVNENISVTLGIIAAIGFLFTLFYFLFVRNKNFNIFNKCGLLIVSALLLATVGSFSSLIAFTMFTQIRCYNRISIFISFLCILVVVILLQKDLKEIRSKYVGFLLVVLLTFIGLRDEVPMNVDWEANFIDNKLYYEELKNVVQQIEDNNQKGAMIFQLPYLAFPEGQPTGEMHDYEQIKPYIASKDNKLHWSYGIMKGEDAAQYNEILAMLPAEKMIEKLREIGFKGILINKRGYDLEEIKSLTSDFNKYLDKPKIENIEFVYYQIN